MEEQSQEKIRSNPPRIYVASLSDYNAGRLYGVWVDADQPAEAIREAINGMLAQSKEPGAEEWAIHDYENFGSLSVSEWADLEKLAEVAFLITQHGPVFAGLLEHLGGFSAVDEARRCMEDAYRGAFDSLADYAQESLEDCFSSELEKVPQFIRYHIDWEGVATDLEINGDVFAVTVNHQVHVFDGHY